MTSKQRMHAMAVAMQGIRRGVWFRAAERQSRCCAGAPDAHDGVIVMVPPVEAMERNPDLRDYILLMAVDDHANQSVEVSLDRECARALVNHLMEAIAESERRAGVPPVARVFQD